MNESFSRAPEVQVLKPKLDAAGVALMMTDRTFQSSGLSPTEQLSVALRLATLAIGRMPEVKTRRGLIINAAVDDFRRNLQKFLPFG